jgi:lysophospholipase L1-like esterase
MSLAAAAYERAREAPRVLLSSSESGPIYGATGGGYVTVARAPVPARTIAGGAGLRIRALLAKYLPNNAGWGWRVAFAQGANTRIIAQNFLGASLGSVETEQVVRFSHDRKFVFLYSQNTLDTASINTAAALPSTGAKTSAAAVLSARGRSTTANVTQTAKPTAETLLVDLDQPCELRIELQPQNGDTVELLAASIELLPPTDDVWSPRATAIWGDSLIEGSGASNEAGTNYPMDVPSQLRRLRPGTPITREGLGGQTAAQIAARVLAAGAKGREWRAIVWAGTNDFTSAAGGVTWWNAVKAAIDAILAFRTSPDTIVCTLHPRASWVPGDANYLAMQYVNAQITATYGSRVCDLFTALATDSGKVPAASMADDIHLTNAGYTTVAGAIHAKATALGWAA